MELPRSPGNTAFLRDGSCSNCGGREWKVVGECRYKDSNTVVEWYSCGICSYELSIKSIRDLDEKPGEGAGGRILFEEGGCRLCGEDEWEMVGKFWYRDAPIVSERHRCGGCGCEVAVETRVGVKTSSPGSSLPEETVIR